MTGFSDEHWMSRCLELAAEAAKQGEVPVGALIVQEDRVIGEGYNQPVSAVDPSAHAEIVALRAAAQAVNNYRLPGATMYVSLEPCTMCAGALVHARISRLVFATSEPRSGAVISQSRILDSDYLNHRVEYQGGCLAGKSSELLKSFFRDRRQGY